MSVQDLLDISDQHSKWDGLTETLQAKLSRLARGCRFSVNLTASEWIELNDALEMTKTEWDEAKIDAGGTIRVPYFQWGGEWARNGRKSRNLMYRDSVAFKS